MGQQKETYRPKKRPKKCHAVKKEDLNQASNCDESPERNAEQPGPASTCLPSTPTISTALKPENTCIKTQEQCLSASKVKLEHYEEEKNI